MDLIPRGVAGETQYRVRDASNRERAVTVQRTVEAFGQLPETERAGLPVFRELAGGIGYLDVARATLAQADSAFQVLGATRALVIDARGMSDARQGTALPAALLRVLERVSANPTTVVDRQLLRVASEPCPPAESQLPATVCVLERRQFDGVVAADTARRYRGRLAVLVDERTQGNMERFVLGMESVANPTFVGSATAGAAGAVTAVQLPGLLTVTFSGTELRHADGRQLQRVGVSPQVEARPTVKSVRAGTDEVLDRAQQWLVQQLDPAPVRRRR
jgi:hypothetical protein